jgi:hypothetical protein
LYRYDELNLEGKQRLVTFSAKKNAIEVGLCKVISFAP